MNALAVTRITDDVNNALPATSNLLKVYEVFRSANNVPSEEKNNSQGMNGFVLAYRWGGGQIHQLYFGISAWYRTGVNISLLTWAKL